MNDDKALLEALAEHEAQYPYPEGLVIGPCVCGGWPGGNCLNCTRIVRAAASIGQEAKHG